MSYKVRHHPPTSSRTNPFIVVAMTNNSVRYFNGRQYRVRQEVDHFVHPLDHARDFTDHITHVMTDTKPYSTKTMRYSMRSF